MFKRTLSDPGPAAPGSSLCCPSPFLPCRSRELFFLAAAASTHRLPKARDSLRLPVAARAASEEGITPSSAAAPLFRRTQSAVEEPRGSLTARSSERSGPVGGARTARDGADRPRLQLKVYTVFSTSLLATATHALFLSLARARALSCGLRFHVCIRAADMCCSQSLVPIAVAESKQAESRRLVADGFSRVPSAPVTSQEKESLKRIAKGVYR
jgi:hypothetical protein